MNNYEEKIRNFFHEIDQRHFIFRHFLILPVKQFGFQKTKK